MALSFYTLLDDELTEEDKYLRQNKINLSTYNIQTVLPKIQNLYEKNILGDTLFLEFGYKCPTNLDLTWIPTYITKIQFCLQSDRLTMSKIESIIYPHHIQKITEIEDISNRNYFGRAYIEMMTNYIKYVEYPINLSSLTIGHITPKNMDIFNNLPPQLANLEICEVDIPKLVIFNQLFSGYLPETLQNIKIRHISSSFVIFLEAYTNQKLHIKLDSLPKDATITLYYGNQRSYDIDISYHFDDKDYYNSYYEYYEHVSLGMQDRSQAHQIVVIKAKNRNDKLEIIDNKKPDTSSRWLSRTSNGPNLQPFQDGEDERAKYAKLLNRDG
jgi:hypothetical protein